MATNGGESPEQLRAEIEKRDEMLRQLKERTKQYVEEQKGKMSALIARYKEAQAAAQASADAVKAAEARADAAQGEAREAVERMRALEAEQKAGAEKESAQTSASHVAELQHLRTELQSTSGAVSNLQAELAQSRAEIARLRSEQKLGEESSTAALKSRDDQMQAIAEKHGAEVKRLEEASVELRKVLGAREEQLTSSQSALTSERAAREAAEAAVARLQASVSASDSARTEALATSEKVIASLKDAMADATSSLADATREKDEAASAAAAKDSRICDLEAELASVGEQQEAMRKQLEESESKAASAAAAKDAHISGLEAELAALRADKSADEQLDSLREQLETSMKQEAELRSTLGRINGEKTEALSALARAEESEGIAKASFVEQQNLLAEAGEQREALRKQLAESEAKVAALQEAEATLGADRERAEKDLAGLTEAKAQLAAEATEAKDAARRSDEAAAALRARIEELEVAAAARESLESSSRSALEALEQDKRDALQRLESLAASLSSAEAARAAAEERCAVAVGEKASSDQQLGNLQAQMVQMHESKGKASDEAENLREQCRALQEEKEKLERHMEERKGKIKEYVGAMQASQKKLQDRVAELEASEASLRSKVESVQEQSSAQAVVLQRQLDEAREGLKAASLEMERERASVQGEMERLRSLADSGERRISDALASAKQRYDELGRSAEAKAGEAEMFRQKVVNAKNEVIAMAAQLDQEKSRVSGFEHFASATLVPVALAQARRLQRCVVMCDRVTAQLQRTSPARVQRGTRSRVLEAAAAPAAADEEGWKSPRLEQLQQEMQSVTMGIELLSQSLELISEANHGPAAAANPWQSLFECCAPPAAPMMPAPVRRPVRSGYAPVVDHESVSSTSSA